MNTLKYEVTIDDPGAYTERGLPVGRFNGWPGKNCQRITARTIGP